MTELRFALQPKQYLFRDAIKRTRNVLFGGAKGGGKSGGLRRVLLIRRLELAGTSAAIFRKTYPELEGNHIRKMFTEYPTLFQYYNESKKLLTLPNKSTIEFCYARNEKDLGNYQGREWDDLAVDEAGEWLEALLMRLRQSNRSSTPGVKPRFILTGNPGGLGHAYLKKKFIQKKLDPGERPEDYEFIQALVDDNAALMENDPDYVRILEAEKSETLRRAYRFGDWDIFAGQFFQEVTREMHVVKDFPVKDYWSKFGAYDFGFNHPAAAGWFAVDEDGNVYLYRLWAKPKTYIENQAKEFLKHPESKDIYFFAGHDCWTKKNVMREENPPTVAEEFSNHGIHLKHATIDRIPGASQLRSYLQPRDHPSGKPKPRFYIFESCIQAFECLARMVHDPDRIEDVLKVDATEGDPETGDDIYDMIRYGMMSRPPITEAPTPKPPVGSALWYAQQNNIDWEREREKMVEADSGGWPEVPANPWGNL